MGKKRKSHKATEAKGPREVDPSEARLGPIATYKDVADPEDEFFMNREEIDFDDEPQSKRQRRIEEEDAFFEHSDEEVLAFDDKESEDDVPVLKPKKLKKSKKDDAESDDEQLGKGEEEGGDQGWWGSSRKEYYDADNIETEADALEEEAEAKRLQKKKLSKMAEEDFVFDGDEWLDEKDTDGDQEVVTEVLKEVEIPEDMSPEDRYKLLTSRYPEFEYLAGEFQELQPQLPELQKEAEGKSSKSVAAIRYWVLGCYVAALASYFAILTSPSRDDAGVQKTMDPAELRDHEVMDTLVSCREAWTKVKHLKAVVIEPESQPTLPEPAQLVVAQDTMPETKRGKAKLEKRKTKKLKNAKEVEDVLADLDKLPLIGKKSKKAAATEATEAQEEDSNSDFGEEESLDAKAAAEKARRKKSLRFYTSQIVQTSNKRANAGRDAGGDMDVPYRERLKDRQARLNAEAERRGRKSSKPGEDLGGEESNDEDATTATAIRNEEDDEYYDMVAASSTKRKAEKAERYAAYAEARKGDLVVQQEEVGEDGKRKINYTIEKNKGLTPKRKKENRNPRVKKRKRYDAKLKKLASMMPVYKGPPAGGYKGVQTGIKAGLIKSTKF